MIALMSDAPPLFREVQPYRELPPFTLLIAAGTLFSWFLVIWAGLLGRPLGALEISRGVALAIGLPLGILLPLAYGRLHMLTEVFPDRVQVNNGMTGRLRFPLSDVVEVEVRTDDIRDDYNVRNVGTLKTTRIAYVVTSDDGVQLTLGDGRQVLIGSKDPQALHEAISAARRAAGQGKP